jgi:hypothetical protein
MIRVFDEAGIQERCHRGVTGSANPALPELGAIEFLSSAGVRQLTCALEPEASAPASLLG